MNKPPRYQSFLVRLWMDDSQVVVELERIPDGERRFFPSVDAMADYLRKFESSTDPAGSDETLPG